jgi:hypothetical protein
MEFGPVIVFGNFKQFQAASGRSSLSFGDTWQARTGVSYHALGGVQLTASLLGRHGYSLPITMAQAIGTDVLAPESMVWTWSPVRWDTHFRLQKTLKESGSVQIEVVGEAFNLFNLNRTEDTATASILRARTARIGLVFSF